MSRRLRVAAWVLAVALAFSGGLSYAIWPSSALWWIGSVATIPLVLLAVSRQEEPPRDSEHFQDPGGGPWSSP